VIIDKNQNEFQLQTSTGSVCKSTLLEMLLQSDRLKRSLLKISDVQVVDGVNYYKFNLEIFLKHLKHKTMSIYQALNNRYEKMDSKLPAKNHRTFAPQDRKNSTSKK
jgi:hypothetical protein